MTNEEKKQHGASGGQISCATGAPPDLGSREHVTKFKCNIIVEETGADVYEQITEHKEQRVVKSELTFDRGNKKTIDRERMKTIKTKEDSENENDRHKSRMDLQVEFEYVTVNGDTELMTISEHAVCKYMGLFSRLWPNLVSKSLMNNWNFYRKGVR